MGSLLSRMNLPFGFSSSSSSSSSSSNSNSNSGSAGRLQRLYVGPSNCAVTGLCRGSRDVEKQECAVETVKLLFIVGATSLPRALNTAKGATDIKATDNFEIPSQVR